MNILNGKPFKKNKKEEASDYLKKELEKRFNELTEKFEISLSELQEHMMHGQNLGEMGS